MVGLYPWPEDLVVCHGDYSMPNIILLNGRVNGFIDLGQLAVADRYVDWLAVRDTFRYNQLPAECFSWFLEEYGVPTLDENKLRFYDLLNRFLG